MTDDLPDEINLESTHTGSAKRIRAGRKFLKHIMARRSKKPLWMRQLRGEEMQKAKAKKHART